MVIKRKNGISLITLIITIVVIVILAGAILLTLATNNPIGQVSKAKFVNDVQTFKEELNMYETSQYANNLGSYNPSSLQADKSSVTYNGTIDTTKTISDVITALNQNKQYEDVIQIVDGQLAFSGYDMNQQSWAQDLGVGTIVSNYPNLKLFPKSETIIKSGTDMVYTLEISSGTKITNTDLTNKVQVLDSSGNAISNQPTFTFGTLSGLDTDFTRQIDITIKTDTMVAGDFSLKVLQGAITNSNNLSNDKEAVASSGFTIDNTAPQNPVMSASNTSWTNQAVSVAITYSNDTVTKQYSFDSLTWNSYTAPVVVTDNNTTVYARGLDIAGNISGVATLTVANIDKISPTVTATNGGSTSSSVTVTATATDAGGSSLNTSSYEYSDDNGSTWTSATNATSYTFTTLTSGTYQCKVKVLDNAGNEGISDAVSISTQTLGTIGLSASPTAWTNGSVTVTITYPAEIVTKQYSLDATTWNTYTAPITVTSNNTTIYAKGLDAGGNQTMQSTLTVANIDNIAPTITAGNGGVTTSSVTITATATDVGGSGVNGSSYQYSDDNGTTWTSVTNATSYTFTALPSGTYQCKVKIADNAGNIGISNAVSMTTTSLGTIAMSASPTGWTNGNVTVTIAYPTEIVTKQYSLDATTWSSYTTPVVVTTNNTTVYAKGLDAGGNQTMQATLTVTNIDKTAPTVAFGTNGNTTYAKSISTTVTANDNVAINTSSLKYQWSTSTSQPSEASFTTSFTNGSSISTPSGVTGIYYLWILAKDTSNNTAIIMSNGFSIDNTKPIITIVGSNPAGVTVGSAYVDEGATASDNVDGNITSKIQVSSNVNTSVKGTYSVTYNVTDNSGNAATPVVRTVTVIDQVSNYSYSGGNQTFTVPVTGTYIIEAVGASGGYTGYNSVGKGAMVEGTFALVQGQVINIAAGAAGAAGSWPAGGGGGGGTFVYNSSTGSLLLAAGGGGGTSTSSSGGDGTYGTPGTGNGGTAPTSTGNMGGTGGGGGGGYLSSGARALNGGYGGGGFSQGLAGGAAASGGGNGGYGGGGGGGASVNWSSNYGGGGAGGGYTGGNGGYCTSGGGGGTSYINPSATNISGTSGLNTGNGYASITYSGSASRSFAYRGIAQTYTVPATGTYKIAVDGASGGSCGYNTPGNGAHVEGLFTLTKGQTFNLIVGGQGGNVSATSGSGGGGRRRWFIRI